MNIENAKTLFFTDKEHYLNFCKAWANAVNSPKAKSHLEPHDEEIRDCAGSYSHSRGTGRHRVPGWIERKHVILYNLLREKHIEAGFTSITNKNKLDNGMAINHSLYYGTYDLIAVCQYAQSAEDTSVLSQWCIKELANIFEPFNGTVTPEMLVKLSKHIPKVSLLKH